MFLKIASDLRLKCFTFRRRSHSEAQSSIIVLSFQRTTCTRRMSQIDHIIFAAFLCESRACSSAGPSFPSNSDRVSAPSSERISGWSDAISGEDGADFSAGLLYIGAASSLGGGYGVESCPCDRCRRRRRKMIAAAMRASPMRARGIAMPILAPVLRPPDGAGVCVAVDAAGEAEGVPVVIVAVAVAEDWLEEVDRP